MDIDISEYIFDVSEYISSALFFYSVCNFMLHLTSLVTGIDVTLLREAVFMFLFLVRLQVSKNIGECQINVFLRIYFTTNIDVKSIRN